HTTERTVEYAAGDARPGVAAVGRFPESAAGTAPVEAARRATPLIGRRVEHLRIRRVHDQVVAAGILVDRQHRGPGAAAVRGAADAAVAARAPEAAQRRDEHAIVVRRIDHDAIDVLRVGQAHVRPRRAAIGRLVDPVAPRGALAV